tara:strand:+ start:343 stop:1074 length:732 start_codon:yes stop_codon:yes gene_type:complete
MHEQAKAAAGMSSGHENERVRIRVLYNQILKRNPSLAETAGAERFIGSTSREQSQTSGAWSYGHGRLLRDTGRVEFTPLAHYTGKVWQGGPELPGSKTGWVHWHAGGGHPGNGDHAAILRWVAPRSTTIEIAGELSRPGLKGDAVRGLVVAGRSIAGQWTVVPGEKAQTPLSLEVTAGEAIDFLVESTGSEAWDSFLWSPVIHERGEPVPLAEAREGFSGPALDRWPLLAQVLLLSNEFLYVD